jgi:hypothetical protein
MRSALLFFLLAGSLTLLSLSRSYGAEPAEPAFSSRQRSHWAFQPPKLPLPPYLNNDDTSLNSIDAFIRARLKQAGLQPAPLADRATLLRRVTFDLTGLPPTLRELDDFLNDTRTDAYVRVVDRLLASPHFGERWAQHWLDVVRYAESNGFEADAERPHAWRYRDYVVASLNEDKPYDRFVTEQLAGDLLWKKDQTAAASLIAAGMNRCGPVHQVGGNVDPTITRNEVLTEMTNAVGAAFLGLTVACARCHSHKFDPFTQADYYRLQAFFHAAKPTEVDLADEAERTEYQRSSRQLGERLSPLRAELNRLETPYRQRLTQAKKDRLEPAYRAALAVEPAKRTPEQKKRAANAQILLQVTWDEIVAALTPADRERRTHLRKQLHKLEAQKPPPPARAWTIREEDSPLTAAILKRGDPLKPGETVWAAFPRILRSSNVNADAKKVDRLALARWLTQPDHPLTARVIVNRLWQHHFGQGLVATSNDFGLRGTPPTHPKLLDWLACELVSHGWSLKHVHRLMVLSATYQQASRWSDPRGRAVDPDNRLLARMNRRRLEGEALRDNALAVAGTLTPALGGPMIRTPLEPEVYELIFTEGEPDGLWLTTPDPRQHTRRSLYLFNKRNLRAPLFEAFDQPDTLNSCPVRPISTFAPQALILLNGPFMRQQAVAFAARVLHTTPGGESDWVQQAYRLALARPPRQEERQMARDFLLEQGKLFRERLHLRLPVAVPEGTPKRVDPALAAAFVDFCLALFNRNEFLYVD